MKPQILMPEPLLQQTMNALEKTFKVHRLWETPDRDSLLKELSLQVRGLATTAGFGASRELMEKLPALEIIACCGVGVDAIDLAAAHQRGIRVSNTPDVLNEDVADLAFGLMLAVSRRVCQGDRHIRAGQWLRSEIRFGKRVSGARLGLLGMGRIGQAIASRAAAFGMTISYHQRNANKELDYTYYSNLAELARDSDFLFCIVPGGLTTRHLVNECVLEALGPEGVLINIARGSVVDENALVEALAEGRLAGAGLDVFANEPVVPEELRKLDNVVLTPHIGSATLDTRLEMGELMIGNLKAYFDGSQLITPVDR